MHVLRALAIQFLALTLSAGVTLQQAPTTPATQPAEPPRHSALTTIPASSKHPYHLPISATFNSLPEPLRKISSATSSSRS
jgi:hypothetical protein